MIKKNNSKDLRCEKNAELCFLEPEKNTIKEIAKRNYKDEEIRRRKLILI